jgi:hypothetical protein
MGEVWQLPALEGNENTGSAWLLNKLQSTPKTSISMILMTLWRLWHVCNEVLHDKPPPPLEVSRRFLSSYLESILQIKHHPNENLEKEKFILDVQEKFHTVNNDHEQAPILSWSPPSSGWCKLDIEGSFGDDASACACMLVRERQ